MTTMHHRPPEHLISFMAKTMHILIACRLVIMMMTAFLDLKFVLYS